jgi:hypothetical protein
MLSKTFQTIVLGCALLPTGVEPSNDEQPAAVVRVPAQVVQGSRTKIFQSGSRTAHGLDGDR